MNKKLINILAGAFLGANLNLANAAPTQGDQYSTNKSSDTATVNIIKKKTAAKSTKVEKKSELSITSYSPSSNILSGSFFNVDLTSNSQDIKERIFPRVNEQITNHGLSLDESKFKRFINDESLKNGKYYLTHFDYKIDLNNGEFFIDNFCKETKKSFGTLTGIGIDLELLDNKDNYCNKFALSKPGEAAKNNFVSLEKPLILSASTSTTLPSNYGQFTKESFPSVNILKSGPTVVEEFKAPEVSEKIVPKKKETVTIYGWEAGIGLMGIRDKVRGRLHYAPSLNISVPMKDRKGKWSLEGRVAMTGDNYTSNKFYNSGTTSRGISYTNQTETDNEFKAYAAQIGAKMKLNSYLSAHGGMGSTWTNNTGEVHGRESQTYGGVTITNPIDRDLYDNSKQNGYIEAGLNLNIYNGTNIEAGIMVSRKGVANYTFRISVPIGESEEIPKRYSKDKK
ncbi:MAG: hypothetical protein KKE23_00200 [Nanoarchaeota archaeon]|nr:hypothetical protein [Nanoarchaeota archaeon]